MGRRGWVSAAIACLLQAAALAAGAHAGDSAGSPAVAAVADLTRAIAHDRRSLPALILRGADHAGPKINERAVAKEALKRTPQPQPDSSKTAVLPNAPPMRFEIVRHGQPGCEPTCHEWIAAEGMITKETPAALRKVLRELGGRKLPIFVDSSGGSVEGGIETGRVVRARGLDVFVTRSEVVACDAADQACREAMARGRAPALPRPHLAKCASSCAFILAGGVRRYVGPSSLVGVHRITTYAAQWQVLRQFRVETRYENGVPVDTQRTLISEKTVSPRIVQARTSDSTYAMIRKFFVEMGIGEAIMPLLLSTPRTQMRWLDGSELAATRIATEAVNGEQLLAGITAPTWTEADRKGAQEALEALRAKPEAGAAAPQSAKAARPR